MKKWPIFLLLMLSSSYTSQEADRLGILIGKASVLIFEEDIVDVELGNPDYFLKIKGKCLLLRAKSKQSAPTTLFVRYGKQKSFYIAEIFPDNNAPLQQIIPAQQATAPAGESLATEQAENNTATIFSSHDKQTYYSYGIRKNGVQIVLTNIAHQKGVTYLRLFIDNNATIALSISNYRFEYVTFLKKFLCFYSKRRKTAEPVSAPAIIELAPNSGDYFEFAIPVYATNGGLELFLGESDQGERDFQLFIPSKVLLKAHKG